MNEDEKILLLSYACNWLFIALCTLISKAKTERSIIHLLIQIIYSSIFLFQLYFNSEKGSTLAWFFFLTLTIWAHTFTLIGRFIFLKFQNRKT